MYEGRVKVGVISICKSKWGFIYLFFWKEVKLRVVENKRVGGFLYLGCFFEML